jgi:amylovoran biosynthesis glycosyltransferase AmsE
MAVYCNDKPVYLQCCLESLIPAVDYFDKLIIVEDGPIPDELALVILRFKSLLKIDLVVLQNNIGLGYALNAGLQHSLADYVVRMDSDDISMPSRLLELRKVLKEDPSIDVLGSYISEFIQDPFSPLMFRHVPLSHHEIVKMMKWRSAMNHVSVAMRRSAVLAVGGYYGGKSYAEDWWLFIRMASSGFKFKNIPLPLVNVRVGDGFFSRRKTLRGIVNDFKMLTDSRRINFLSPFDFLVAFSGRLLIFILPSFLLFYIYISFLRVKAKV